MPRKANVNEVQKTTVEDVVAGIDKEESGEVEVISKKQKSVFLRPVRWITIDHKGVVIKFEPEKDDQGKLKRNETGGLVGKVVEIKQDMWKDPLCMKEFVVSVTQNKYCYIEPEI